ncbi:MAG: nucleoside permease [Planctomycetota bacterium]
MNPTLTARLCVMMFFQFFMWGSWYVLAYVYLGQIGFGPSEIAITYSVGPIAGMLSPFFVGMIADRFFSTERIMGVLHLAGAAIMFGAVTLMKADVPSPGLINLVFLGYMLTYYPTLSLTNTLALHNMDDAEKQFPVIRVFGTIGWIAAGLLISLCSWNGTIEMFYVATAAAAVMGIYSFSLPHTPPPAAGEKITAREVLGLDALILLKRPAYLAFMVSSFLICIPLAFYYQLAGAYVSQSGFEETSGATMSYGQMSEVFFMLVMPFFFARLGVKWMLFVGMLAWVVRYALFAFGAPDEVAWMIIGGIVLHGICYDFFFVTGQIYTDKVATKAIRGQAQGMLVFFTLGLGMLIGAQVAGVVEAQNTPENAEELSTQAEELTQTIDSLAEEYEVQRGSEATDTKEEIDDLTARRDDLLERAALDWKSIWMFPAIFAAVIMLLFVFVFHEKKEIVQGAEVV